MPINSTGGKKPTGRSASSKRTSSARKPASRSGSASKRRKRKNKAQNYLYLAASLSVIFIVLLVFLITQISGCSDDTTSFDESENESSSQSDVSFESNNSGTTENSGTSTDVSSESSADISDNSSNPDTDNPIADKIAAYEKYIGVEYAIDMTEYEKYVCPDNADKFVYIVNPNHTLSSDYVPSDLVKCTNIRKGRPDSYSYIDRTANKALEAFLKEAAKYGYGDVTVTNAYRSYSTQAGLFKNYLESDLKEDYVCDTCHSYIDISYYPKNVKTIVTLGEATYFCNGCGAELQPDEEGKFFCEIEMMEVISPEIRQDRSEKTVCFSCKDCGNGKDLVSDENGDYYCNKCEKAVVPCMGEVRRPTEDEATKHVLTYSTKPGTSEHQTGLCCDMHNMSSTTSAFDNTPAAKWLAANAHRFGFILRYPQGKQHITGIKHESWHFRFVGRDAATEMYEKGLTLEEYLGEV